jgi:lactobin A/cerein 7B family class IIb bacteriocin
MDMNPQKGEISNTQNSEISALELTTEELDDVSGGGANNQLIAALYAGLFKGYVEGVEEGFGVQNWG